MSTKPTSIEEDDKPLSLEERKKWGEELYNKYKDMTLNKRIEESNQSTNGTAIRVINNVWPQDPTGSNFNGAVKIEEGLEEAAIRYAKSQGFTDDMDLDYQQEAFIAGANHQKEVDKANVEQIFNRAIVGNNEFIKVMEKQGTPSDQTALYFKKLNRDLTDLIKQIKAL